MKAGLLEGIKEAAGLLEAWGKPGALIGGLAFVARVRPRFTDDIDLLLTVPQEQLEAFLDLAARRGFSFGKEDRQGFLDAGLLSMKSPLGLSFDVLVADDPLLNSAVKRATPLDFGGVSIPVISIEDLLLLKLDANRYLDLDDAIAIKDAHGATLDRAYLAQLAEAVGIVDRLERLLGKA